jgi:uncharacterized protein YjbJ (UPF0337 family)
MDWNAVIVEWKVFRGEVRAHWGRLTDPQLNAIAGLRARLAEQIRDTYGLSDAEAEHQIRRFEARNQVLRTVSRR